MKEFEQIEQIIGLVGRDNAISICQTFAGETVYFPKNALIYLRNQKIRDEFKAGASYRELSLRYELTTRQIRKITAGSDSIYSEGDPWLFPDLHL